jgi:hypothetical protein
LLKAGFFGWVPASMYDDFNWRNLGLFVAALVVTSCLMAWGVILALDLLLYPHWEHEVDAPIAQPLKLERTSAQSP